MMTYLIFIALAASGIGQTTDSRWKAGLARADITPDEPIWMAGYADRTRPSEGVRQRLHAKALALEDESGAKAVLVTLDLIGLPRNAAEPIARMAEQRHGLARERLMLNASHTHSGPMAGYHRRPNYEIPDQTRLVVHRYTDRLVEQVVNLIGEALRDLAPARLEMEMGLAGFAVNRRRVQQRHLPGPVDHDVLVVSVRGADGKQRGVLFGYACHATVLNDYQISGDWPGYAQEEIERAHSGVMALFVAGCGADQNPLPRRTVELAQTYGKVMAVAVSQVLRGRMTALGGRLGTAIQHVDLPFEAHPPKSEWQERAQSKSQAVARHARQMLAAIAEHGSLPASYSYPVQVWRFGPRFTLVALAGEVVVDYSLRLRKLLGWNQVWVASYSNDVFAYIPSARVLEEGGYEGRDAMLGYGQPGAFAPPVEEIIVSTVSEMVRRLGER